MAGWNGDASGARERFPRSIASVYWMRSLVPMLKNSASRASTSAMITALGTSIMIPSGTCLARACPRLSTSCMAWVEELADLAQLVDARDHGDHDAKVAVRARPDHGPQLGEEHVGP